ncbi:MAG: hypothetical protein JW874_06135 [Spirochaetales bacterium]|nr:hypothetical protein [Spirochaetales bacterium]
MHQKIISGFRFNILKNFILVYSIVVGPILYCCFTFVDAIKSGGMPLVFVLFGFQTCIVMSCYALLHRRSHRRLFAFLKNGETGGVKKTAYHYPFIAPLVYGTGWVVLSNLLIILPHYLIVRGALHDYLIVNLLLLSGCMISLPITFFVSEHVSSRFLNLDEVVGLEEPEQSVRLGLSAKIVIVCLSIILCLVFNVAATTMIDQIYSFTAAQNATSLAIIGLQGVCAAVVSSVLFARSVRKPILNIKKSIDELNEKEGDLTITLPRLANDELGDTTAAMTLFLRKMRRIVQMIVENTGILSDIGTNLKTSMNETAASVHEISTNISNISNAAGNMMNNVNDSERAINASAEVINALNAEIGRQSCIVTQSTSAIEQMMASISSVAETLNRNALSISSLAAASGSGRKDLSEMNSSIDQVAKESEGLLGISRIIEDIANQTNLLAMNAAIEAAHAGEFGKGFGVVAAEVRKLAESSGTQAKTVSVILERIKKLVDSITEKARTVSGNFNRMDADIQAVFVQENNIRSAMDEQSAGSREILNSVTILNEITQKINNDSRGVIQKIEEVISKGTDLNSLGTEIAQGMNEMSSGAGQILSAVNTVNKMSKDNEESISILREELGRFRITAEQK